MIDDEIEELESELEEAENNALKANRELKAVRDELVTAKSEAFETEKELRKELSTLRKRVEYMAEREARAKESVEKRRSSRGEFWSPSRTFSEVRRSEGRRTAGAKRRQKQYTAYPHNKRPFPRSLRSRPSS